MWDLETLKAMNEQPRAARSNAVIEFIKTLRDEGWTDADMRRFCTSAFADIRAVTLETVREHSRKTSGGWRNPDADD